MPQLILLADHSKTVQQATLLSLTKNPDWRLVVCLSANEVLAKALADKPAVILLDHLFETAADLYKQLLENPQTCSIPIVVLGKSVAKERFFNAHAFLSKPFEAKTLIQALPAQAQAEAPVIAPATQTTLASDALIQKIIQQRVEEAVWEIVPILAEKLIRQELDRLVASKLDSASM